MVRVTLSLKKNEYPNNVLKYFKTSVNLLADNIPEASTFPWIGAHPMWDNGSGPLLKHEKDLWRKVKNIGTDTQRWVEKQFRDFLPRNVQVGSSVEERIKDVFTGALIGFPGDRQTTRVPTPFLLNEITLDDFLEAIAASGITPYADFWRGYDWLEDEALVCEPGNSQASLGITLSVDKSEGFVGSKGDVWGLINEESYGYLNRIRERNLRFDELDYEKAKDICHQDGLIYKIGLRVDGNFNRPRFIFMGTSTMYCIEKPLTVLISQLYKKTKTYSFAYSSDLVSKKCELLFARPEVKLNADLSRFDLHQSFKLLKMLYQAFGLFLGLPEELMAYLFCYNSAAPIILPFREDDGSITVKLWDVEGMARSGSGIFTVMNSMLCFVINYITARNLARRKGYNYFAPECVVFGDNHVVVLPPRVGVHEWGAYLASHFGMDLKVTESIDSRDTIIMLRRCYTRNGIGYPVIMSRARNALCPKYSNCGRIGARGMPYEIVALILRDQSMHIAEALRKNRRYIPIWKYWLEKIVCYKLSKDEYVTFNGVTYTNRMLRPMTDAELSRRLHGFWKTYDSINWTKSFFGVTDSSQILDTVIEE